MYSDLCYTALRAKYENYKCTTVRMVKLWYGYTQLSLINTNHDVTVFIWKISTKNCKIIYIV